jgi:tetratricopeptide (TPR) repeat protein
MAALVFVLVDVCWLRAEEEITYRDRVTRQDALVIGTITSESINEVVVRPTGKTGMSAIPARDVVDIVYTIPVLYKQEYRAALHRETLAERAPTTAERVRELTAVLKKYQELQPRLAEEKARRHIEFKIADLLAQLALTDPARADTAIVELSRFRTSHPRGWQTCHATALLGQMYLRKGMPEEAQKAYEQLEAVPDLAAELRLECGVQTVTLLARMGRYAEAEKRIAKLSASAIANSLSAQRLRVLRAECEAARGKSAPAVQDLQALIEASSDSSVKALAYNALGDCWRQAQKPKEALWAYLWVDVIYHQDPLEHARALYHIVTLFRELNDEPRAQQFRAKLLNDRQFAGLEYQRLLASEK